MCWCCCRFCCCATTTDVRIHAPVLHDASQIAYCRYWGRASLPPITSILICTCRSDPPHTPPPVTVCSGTVNATTDKPRLKFGWWQIRQVRKHIIIGGKNKIPGSNYLRLVVTSLQSTVTANNVQGLLWTAFRGGNASSSCKFVIVQ